MPRLNHPSPLVRTHNLGGKWQLIPGDPLPDGRDLGPNGEPQWAVAWYVRNGTYCSSLEFALDTGTLEECAVIPPSVMSKLQKKVDALSKASLY